MPTDLNMYLNWVSLTAIVVRSMHTNRDTTRALSLQKETAALYVCVCVCDHQVSEVALRARGGGSFGDLNTPQSVCKCF